MDIRDLGRLDLNLLVALEALLEEGSVSKAADRLFITQSAMSKTLGRLRQLFDDPLFIRKGAAMMPTPRAEQLARELPRVLLAVQDLLEPETFDPRLFDGHFNLQIPGHMALWLMPLLVERLAITAPNIRLSSLSGVDKPFDQLNNGRLDFILQAELRDYPDDLRLTTLGYARPVLLARRGHPLEGKELAWDDILRYPHVQLLADEIAEIHFLAPEESTFMRQKAAAIPELSTDQLLTAIQVVRSSDYLFPAPPLFMEQGDLSMDLIALEFPKAEEVSLRYVMVDHQRFHAAAAHDFVYQEILHVIDNFRIKYSLPSLTELREIKKLAY